MGARFIELHLVSSGGSTLINLDHIKRLAPARDNQCNVYLAGDGNTSEFMIVREPYEQLKAALLELSEQ